MGQSTPISDAVTGNALLDQLPEATCGRVLSAGECIRVEEDEVLVPAGRPIAQVYFPVTAVVSLMLSLSSGQRAETATVGNEGMVGIGAVVGRGPNEWSVVQLTGESWRLPVAAFLELLDQDRALRDAVRRYTGIAYYSARQTALCNAYHTVDQRVARWLLTAADRARRSHFPLTQHALSERIAASRPRVSEALSRLRDDGLVACSRGFLEIKDRELLRCRSCECYAPLDERAPRPFALFPDACPQRGPHSAPPSN